MAASSHTRIVRSGFRRLGMIRWLNARRIVAARSARRSRRLRYTLQCRGRIDRTPSDAFRARARSRLPSRRTERGLAGRFARRSPLKVAPPSLFFSFCGPCPLLARRDVGCALFGEPVHIRGDPGEPLWLAAYFIPFSSDTELLHSPDICSSRVNCTDSVAEPRDCADYVSSGDYSA